MKVRFITIDERSLGQRIDNFLLRELKGIPRSKVYRILRKGEVRVDGRRVKPEYKLSVGEKVRIPPVHSSQEKITSQAQAPQASKALLATLEAAILHEDEHLIFVNKPAGLAVHGGSGITIGLIEAFRQLRPELKSIELVHRLDRETSGVLMLAKSLTVLRELHELLLQGQIEKRYQALVCGVWSGGEQRIDTALEKQPHQRQKIRVSPTTPRKHKHAKGTAKHKQRWASSIFSPLRLYQNTSLLEVRLLTGRMHQIRVQASHLGHPLCGDKRYGDFKKNREYQRLGLKRLFLHAYYLHLQLPLADQEYTIHAPLTKDLEKVLMQLPLR